MTTGPARKALSTAVILIFLVSTLQGAAQAHGDCSLDIDQPFRSGVLLNKMNARARYTCDEGHARIAIRVKLQVRLVSDGGWETRAIANDSNNQAKTVFAVATDGCRPSPGFEDSWRTFVEYARVFNADGDLVHQRNDVAGAVAKPDCVG
jgi:hypothetical protein